jgi:hypothetical protein
MNMHAWKFHDQVRHEGNPFTGEVTISVVLLPRSALPPERRTRPAAYLRLPPTRRISRSFGPITSTSGAQPLDRSSTPQMHCGPRHALRLSRSLPRHHVSGLRAAFSSPTDDFRWFPRFFDPVEQHTLLSAALRKLDAVEPRASRKRRRDFLASQQRQDPPKRTAGVLENAFLPDDLYRFEEVRHFSLLFWRLQ